MTMFLNDLLKKAIFPFLIIFSLFFLNTGRACAESDLKERLDDSAKAFHSIMRTNDTAIPRRILNQSHAIVVVPSMLKGGFGIGARIGNGVLISKNPKTGKWGAPSFISTGGLSIGYQIGVQKIDLILIVMNRSGLESLLNDKFTVGADASVAVGPLGRHVEAGTDFSLDAEIYSYSKVKGLFLGVSLEGTIISPDENANEIFYKKKVSPRDILLNGAIKKIPKDAKLFINVINKYAGKKK